MTRISAVTKMSRAISSNQSSIPTVARVIRFDTNRSPTAATERTVNTTPVAMIAGPLVLRPCIVSITVGPRGGGEISCQSEKARFVELADSTLDIPQICKDLFAKCSLMALALNHLPAYLVSIFCGKPMPWMQVANDIP